MSVFLLVLRKIEIRDDVAWLQQRNLASVISQRGDFDGKLLALYEINQTRRIWRDASNS